MHTPPRAATANPTSDKSSTENSTENSNENTPPFAPARAWWKSAVVYQIYPMSFLDADGDGMGDLRGIGARLDYLKDLGVDALWLSPVYASPMADMGYDISDYCAIDPRYGTLDDWDRLCAGVHARGMKLMMDLVINHTSDEHEWFKQSRSSKTHPKRDWYIWRPPRYDARGTRCPPNNWRSAFQGSAWEWDEGTQEYYLHLYVAKQPDLNWENPAVRAAAWDVMRFWIARGCDGFRMDVINLISKVDGLPDAPITDPGEETQPASMYFANGPRVHEYLKEMHAEVLSAHDLLTVGETPFTHDAAHLVEYVLPQNGELNMVFQFELMDLDSPREGADCAPLSAAQPWALADLRRTVARWQAYRRADGFWNAIFTENHDHARAVSRFGNDAPAWRALSAQMLAALQVGQCGTQFVYQGQELGLANFPRAWGIAEYKDVASVNYWDRVRAQRQRATGEEDPDMEDVLDVFQKKARDHARVPMQWDATPNAGFTTGTPWMRVNDDYKTWNASAQLADDTSVLAFWTKALALRKQHDVLIYGDFTDISHDSEAIFAFTRTLAHSKAVILLNFTEHEVDFAVALPWAGGRADGLRLLLGNYDTGSANGTAAAPLDPSGGPVRLRGYEARIYCTV